jgi:hypothetical protein
MARYPCFLAVLDVLWQVGSWGRDLPKNIGFFVVGARGAGLDPPKGKTLTPFFTLLPPI